MNGAQADAPTRTPSTLQLPRSHGPGCIGTIRAQHNHETGHPTAARSTRRLTTIITGPGLVFPPPSLSLSTAIEPPARVAVFQEALQNPYIRGVVPTIVEMGGAPMLPNANVELAIDYTSTAISPAYDPLFSVAITTTAGNTRGSTCKADAGGSWRRTRRRSPTQTIGPPSSRWPAGAEAMPTPRSTKYEFP